MRRREFIALVGGTALAWPHGARAQQPAVPLIGYMHSGSLGPGKRGFLAGLQEAGYVEGQNVAIEYRWAEGRYERLPELAADLVRRRSAVIFAAGGTVSARAAKAATTTIPIVFEVGADPVKAGLVGSLNRPEGNMTGVTLLTGPLEAKRFELLVDLVPAAATIALLVNPQSLNTEAMVTELQAAARSVARKILVLQAVNDRELEEAFAGLVQQRPDALIVMPDPFFVGSTDRILSLAARQKLPAMYGLRQYTDAGGLISYGADVVNVFRQGGIYVGRILKGAKPADLPVLQPAKFELVVNAKAAQALGIPIPPSILLRADEVIE